GVTIPGTCNRHRSRGACRDQAPDGAPWKTMDCDLRSRMSPPTARMLPPTTRVLSRALAASAAVLLCACATLGPEPAHAVMCSVTVHFENRTGYLFRLAIDDMPVRSIARSASTANYRFAYRGASDGLCYRTSVELTARAVRQNGAPGWFVPLVNADG